ncbi:hypothetical protein GOC29_08665 [Sinorhizobium meliloti]|nr:hypothetical protein [Sinorhizobium meliloti]MDX0130845.1 hypothetical protein [Sinorhizobium meliloti]
MPSRVPRNGVSRQTTFQNRRKTGVYGRALVYNFVFNLAYDRVFPIPAGRRAEYAT